MPDIVKTLIKIGADIEAKNSEGNTPLHFAAQSGNTEVIMALLAAGADINATNQDGLTHYNSLYKKVIPKRPKNY